MKKIFLMGFIVFCALAAKPALAAVWISEFLADPPLGILGDSNGDLTRSSSEDEFIELYNEGADPISLLGWSLSDADSTRHIFGDIQIQPYQFWVVFGGGSLAPHHLNAETASSGRLSLNNQADTIILKDSGGNFIDTLSYDETANRDQSLVRTKVTSPFELHSVVSAEGELYSPGEVTNQKELPSAKPVPEAHPTWLLLCLIVYFVKRKYRVPIT